MPRLKPDQWETIKKLYYADVPVKSICSRFGIAAQSFYDYAERAKWPKKRSLKNAQKDPERDLQAVLGNASAVLLQTEVKLGGTGVELGEQVTTQEHAVIANPPASPMPALDSVRRDHLRIAGKLRTRIEAILDMKTLGTTDRDRLTAALIDLTRCLEAIQKIEERALGVDEGRPAVAPVIIVVPAKADPGEWNAKALAPNWTSAVVSEGESTQPPSNEGPYNEAGDRG